MKIWGIIATVLLVAAAGFGVWQYTQNQDLKSQKSKLETDLAAANTAKTTAETTVTAKTAKMTAAGKKVEILNTMFGGISTREQSDAIFDQVKTLNDTTLTADFQAMTNSKPGDASGTKVMTDLLSSAASDLK